MFQTWNRSWIKHQTKLALWPKMETNILNHNYFNPFILLESTQCLENLKLECRTGPQIVHTRQSRNLKIFVGTIFDMSQVLLLWLASWSSNYYDSFFWLNLPQKYQGRGPSVIVKFTSIRLSTGPHHKTRIWIVLCFDVLSDTFCYQHFWGICSSDKCFLTGKQFSTLQRWVTYLFIYSFISKNFQ